MRRLVPAILLLLAACKASGPMAPSAADADSAAAGPHFSVSAAPGMSLTYQYGFRLPVTAIATAQEDNAAQCEALGPATCRITGMSYEVGRDRTVTAALHLKLAPQAARAFGKQAIAAIVKRGGMLASAQIDSEETGATAAEAQGQQLSLQAQQAHIQQQLAQPGLGPAERSELQAQAATLADAIRAAQTALRGAAVQLASTPMTLAYETGEVDQSLSDGPIVGAIKDGWANVITGVAVIVMLVVTLVPWVVCVTLGVWGWRRFGRQWFTADLSGHRSED